MNAVDGSVNYNGFDYNWSAGRYNNTTPSGTVFGHACSAERAVAAIFERWTQWDAFATKHGQVVAERVIRISDRNGIATTLTRVEAAERFTKVAATREP